MTPEREKYLESITEREKALKQEIRNQKRALHNLKFRLSHSVNQTADEVYKEHIKHRKYIVCALKHELERIQPTTDIEYVAQRGYIDAYKCCKCHKEFTFWDDNDIPKYCPNCHMRIERDC